MTGYEFNLNIHNIDNNNWVYLDGLIHMYYNNNIMRSKIDFRLTRAIIIEMNVYNRNSNLFSSVNLICEFTAKGSVSVRNLILNIN